MCDRWMFQLSVIWDVQVNKQISTVAIKLKPMMYKCIQIFPRFSGRLSISTQLVD